MDNSNSRVAFMESFILIAVNNFYVVSQQQTEICI